MLIHIKTNEYEKETGGSRCSSILFLSKFTSTTFRVQTEIHWCCTEIQKVLYRWRIYRRRIWLNACRCSATVFYVGIQQECNQLVISWIKFPFAIFMAVLICFWFLQTAVNESEKDRGQSELDVTGCLPTGNLCNLLGISWQFSPQLLNVKKIKSPVNRWF